MHNQPDPDIRDTEPEDPDFLDADEAIRRQYMRFVNDFCREPHEPPIYRQIMEAARMMRKPS